MEDNPFSAILGTIRTDSDERSAPAWRLGRVTSVSPLVVQVAGCNLTASDLLANPMLLGYGTTATLSGVTGSLAGSPEGMSVSGGSLSGGVLLGGCLAAGDQVVLLQSGDGQQFVVLCKVVRPN